METLQQIYDRETQEAEQFEKDCKMIDAIIKKFQSEQEKKTKKVL